MKFEKSIMSTIHPVLKGSHAYFFDGALYVQCDEPVARKIYQHLNNSADHRVIASKSQCKPEYIFDFA